MLNQDVRVVSFDGTEVVTADVARPERYRDLGELLSRGPSIARGAGLSYSAASMGERSTSVDMTRFDRVLEFDPISGAARVEAGLSVGALTEFLVSRGFYLPVLPGYPDITLGGCVAFDIHGKSQIHTGNFGDWVNEIRLLHPDHGELRLDRDEHPELFGLTLGGFGLTGLITEIALRTSPLPGDMMELDALPVAGLREAVDVMQRRVAEVDALYSWHDLNQGRFGAGVVFVERFVKKSAVQSRSRRPVSIRTRSRVPLWNRWTTPFIMGCYSAVQRISGRRTLNVRKAMFPIEGLEVYYLCFGKRGFREYQLILPVGAWGCFVRAFEPLIRRSGLPVPLASLKLFRGSQRNLAFAGEGVCLAIDVPALPSALRLFAEMDELVVQHGGSINLSKDSRASEQVCRSVFPDYERFKQSLARFDPKQRFQSRLRDRIGV